MTNFLHFLRILEHCGYTRCVCCGFLPTFGSIGGNNYQMISHYIVKHFREKCDDFLKLNRNSVPPYVCHICGFSPMKSAGKHDLLRHYVRIHGILERFYQEGLSEPEPDPKQLKPPPQSLDYTRCVYCGFTTTCKFRKSQMTNHYIRKHFKEKCQKILKRNNKFHKPPFFCHECGYSTKRDKHELFKHYARHHGILERFCEEKFKKFNNRVLMSEISDNNAKEVEEMNISGSEHVPDEQSQNAENADPNSQNVDPKEQSQNNFQNAENADANSSTLSSPDISGSEHVPDVQSQNDFQNVENVLEHDDDESYGGVTYKCDFCIIEIKNHWNNMKVIHIRLMFT